MTAIVIWIVVIGLPVVVALSACVARRGRSVAALTLFVILLSVAVWFALETGCGFENGSDLKYARCDRGYPKLPLFGTAVAGLGVGLGQVSRRTGLMRGALALGLVPSAVAWILMGA